MLKFIDEAIADGSMHGLILVDRQHVQVDKLSLGQHQLDITIFVCNVIGAGCAVE